MWTRLILPMKMLNYLRLSESVFVEKEKVGIYFPYIMGLSSKQTCPHWKKNS